MCLCPKIRAANLGSWSSRKNECLNEGESEGISDELELGKLEFDDKCAIRVAMVLIYVFFRLSLSLRPVRCEDRLRRGRTSGPKRSL